jgi:tRNA-uridine 2-sulfurtransferase
MTSSKKTSEGKKGRVAVAMSGGVDSSLVAALLSKQGYQVIGLTFRMWPKDECGASFGKACCNLEAITRARMVAEELSIPYYVFDFSEEFKKEVIDYFCEQYLKGITPNPCVMCNEKIKFGLLHEKALALGADLIATGHYAKVEFDKEKNRYLLKEGLDKEKDQSYFLFSLSQEQLQYAVFPLAGYTKEKTREAAKKLKLKTFDMESSQDICFIRDLNYAEYIKTKTKGQIKEGDIVDASGNVLGRHKGILFYTIGQRRGLGIAHKEPLYVIEIDRKNNRVIVGTKKDVMKKSLIANDLNWISVPGIDKPMKVKAVIRYNHKKQPATVTPVGTTEVRVDFDSPQEAPTPGQAVVFYDNDTVVGGGWIKEVVY